MRSESPPAPSRTSRPEPSKSIKVKNIPGDLDLHDIKDAFESEAGRIVHCEKEGSTAWITFESQRDAKKAVDTFDHGELNGKTIAVMFYNPVRTR